MKSLTAVCQTGASMPAINPNGRISRHPPHRGDGENAEMKMYLSKLKDLVPFMPKNRKLSKLEIIQHVIDYICDLQSELETHPEINNFDATAALTFAANSLERVTAANSEGEDEEMHDEHQVEDEEVNGEAQERLNGGLLSSQQYHYQSSPAQRQPLVDRQTPNTILPPATTQQQQQRQMNPSAVATAASSQNYHHHHHVSSSLAVSSVEAASMNSQASTAHTLSVEKDMNSRQSC